MTDKSTEITYIEHIWRYPHNGECRSERYSVNITGQKCCPGSRQRLNRERISGEIKTSVARLTPVV